MISKEKTREKEAFVRKAIRELNPSVRALNALLKAVFGAEMRPHRILAIRNEVRITDRDEAMKYVSSFGDQGSVDMKAGPGHSS